MHSLPQLVNCRKLVVNSSLHVARPMQQTLCRALPCRQIGGQTVALLHGSTDNCVGDLFGHQTRTRPSTSSAVIKIDCRTRGMWLLSVSLRRCKAEQSPGADFDLQSVDGRRNGHPVWWAGRCSASNTCIALRAMLHSKTISLSFHQHATPLRCEVP